MKHGLIEVEAYAGYKGAEMPRSFFWEGKKHEVKQLKKTWHQESSRGKRFQFFLFQADDAKEYLISFSEEEDKWYMEKAASRCI